MRTDHPISQPASRCLRWVAALLCALALLPAVLGGTVARAEADFMGPNGGVRLLLHIDEDVSYPTGKPETDPCGSLPPVSGLDDIAVTYDGDADTVMVWAYLHHPQALAVRGVGFGIRYEGVKVVTSGTCADMVWQDGEEMGTWAQSGAEIAFAWRFDSAKPVVGTLHPFGWFLLARTADDGFFELNKGKTPFAGAVADTNRIPKRDPIWAYGRVGFGSADGDLPIVDPRTEPAVYGAARIEGR